MFDDWAPRPSARRCLERWTATVCNGAEGAGRARFLGVYKTRNSKMWRAEIEAMAPTAVVWLPTIADGYPIVAGHAVV